MARSAEHPCVDGRICSYFHLVIWSFSEFGHWGIWSLTEFGPLRNLAIGSRRVLANPIVKSLLPPKLVISATAGNGNRRTAGNGTRQSLSQSDQMDPPGRPRKW